MDLDRRQAGRHPDRAGDAHVYDELSGAMSHKAGEHRRPEWVPVSLSGLAGVIVLPLFPSWVFWTIAVGVALLWALLGLNAYMAWRQQQPEHGGPLKP